jgi:hypothetical protein
MSGEKLFDTSKRIRHVFGCTGEPTHVFPGLTLAKINTGDVILCPTCGKPVHDITNTPLGQSYFERARPDLGAEQ